MSIINVNNKTYGVDKFMFALGVALLIWSVMIYQDAKIKFEHKEMTRGYIIKYIDTKDNKRIPVIGFETIGGESRTFADRTPLLSTRQKKEMFIAYNPKNLDEVLVWDEFESERVPMSIAMIGVVLLAFGFIIFRVRNRK